MEYEIVSFNLHDAHKMYVLRRIGAPCFMDVLEGDPKKQKRAALIKRAAERVERYGIEWARESKTLRKIDSKLFVYELRVAENVIRVMTYLHKGVVPVYLFDFDGHKGKSGNISSSDKEKGRNLAKIAQAILEKGDSDA